MTEKQQVLQGELDKINRHISNVENASSAAVLENLKANHERVLLTKDERWRELLVDRINEKLNPSIGGNN